MDIALVFQGKTDPDSVTLQFYALRTTNDKDQPFWLENNDGEGMSMTEQGVFDALHEHFKKNF